LIRSCRHSPGWNRRAADPLFVKIAVPLPYGLVVDQRDRLVHRVGTDHESTGPKISSRYTSIDVVTLSITVGPTKKPFS